MFTPKTLSFLRSLKRNNEREWFHARKDQFETHCRAPMVEIIERLAVDMRSFAPELIADPKVSLFRQYREERGKLSPAFKGVILGSACANLFLFWTLFSS